MSTDFDHLFSVLPGDINQGGIVLSNDSAIVMSKQLTTPGDPDYSILADVDGIGSIFANDTGHILSRHLSTLPTGSP